MGGRFKIDLFFDVSNCSDMGEDVFGKRFGVAQGTLRIY
jgi:hypothetical protein